MYHVFILISSSFPCFLAYKRALHYLESSFIFFFHLTLYFLCKSHRDLFMLLSVVHLKVKPFMISSRQEYWSVLPFPSPGDLPDPGIKPGSPALQADALISEPPSLCIYFAL